MADHSLPVPVPVPVPAEPEIPETNLLGIKHLLWGNDIRAEIFKRWSQGFHFSANEKSALEQNEGGPCSIIAPVQAFIVKNLLLEHKDLSFREKVTSDTERTILINALCEILEQCTLGKYYITSLKCDVRENSELVMNEVNVDDSALEESGSGCSNSNFDNLDSSAASDSASPVFFHDHLSLQALPSLQDVSRFYRENYSILTNKYGVLLFLYSVIATRTLEQVKQEADTAEPLIDSIYGYGSQNLINLMITGRATTYVWDHDQDAGGLRLRGVEKQSQIGYITIMEHYRYCTVGSFYKNPVYPIWVVGSDTHLTVIFSDEVKLVSPETKSEKARRVFKSFDPEGNNFISAPLLQDVLQSLELVSDEEYVAIMKNKLDPEGLGIILLNSFMEEFFPIEESSVPDMFTIVHYNGLPQSNPSGQIQYHIGSAILLESDIKSVLESNPMLTVLQTKWPNIDVNWCENRTPSLN